MQYVDAVQFLLLHPRLDIQAQTDFQGLSPFQFAIMNSSNNEVMELINNFAVSGMMCFNRVDFSCNLIVYRFRRVSK